MTKILPCGCRSAYQDVHYGVGMRVHNFAPKGGKPSGIAGWRCTVCKSFKPMQSASATKAAKKVSAKRAAKEKKRKQERAAPVRGTKR